MACRAKVETNKMNPLTDADVAGIKYKDFTDSMTEVDLTAANVASLKLDFRTNLNLSVLLSLTPEQI